jgi:hypothetical protein
MANVFWASTVSRKGPVRVSQSAPAPMAQELCWRCQVCGQEMGHSQPVGLGLAINLLKVFIDWHEEKCGKDMPNG